MGRRSENARASGDGADGVDGLGRFLNDIGRCPLLTAAEEIALAKRIECGDDEARRRMVESNLRLVVAIARPSARTATGALPERDRGDELARRRARRAGLTNGRRGAARLHLVEA